MKIVDEDWLLIGMSVNNSKSIWIRKIQCELERIDVMENGNRWNQCELEIINWNWIESLWIIGNENEKYGECSFLSI